MKKVNLKATLLLLATASIVWTACEKKDDPKPGGGSEGNKPAIELDCDYFKEDRVLTDDPEAPVDYIISCESQVTANLTVEPGVVIAFTEDASLVFKNASSFKMEGTEDKSIVLTGVEAQKGFWRGVLVEETNKASNSMKYLTIEYAGSKSTSHVGYPEAGLQIAQGGSVSIDHCTFQNNQGSGIYWAETSVKQNTFITNSIFTKNDLPMTTEGRNQIKLYNNTNDYTGNVNDYVHLQYPGIDNDKKEITWKKINVPYYITTRIYNRFDVDHAQLIIEPGTDIIMATAETHMRIRSDASITAVGTESDPIIFRGEHDVPASWGYILIESSSALNEIAFAKIKNAGHSMNTPVGALQVTDGAYLTVHDLDFSNNAGYAISLYWHGSGKPVLVDYSNITTDNGKKFSKGDNGPGLSDPNDPNSTI